MIIQKGYENLKPNENVKGEGLHNAFIFVWNFWCIQNGFEIDEEENQNDRQLEY